MASPITRPDSPDYYIQHSVNGKPQRLSTGSSVLQIAKKKLRQFESAQARGEASTFPTRTPIPDVLAAYLKHLRVTKTAKCAQTDIYYLREAFAARVCREKNWMRGIVVFGRMSAPIRYD